MNSKILDIRALEDKIKALKKNKKKIILCHGVFDVLHLGHINYFEEAKKNASILIVSITSNEYVNKGPYHPIFNDLQRSKMIASIELVDYVFINEDFDAVNLISTIKPDYYVKGSDYKDKSKDLTKKIYAEERAIKNIGGKLIFTKNPNFSSSTIINYYNYSLNSSQSDYINRIKKNISFVDLDKYLSKLKEKKVLVVGETIIDEYITCNTLGKAGKDPILTFQNKKSESYAGGVIAIANHLSEFVKKVQILSYLGDENNKIDFVKKSLKRNVSFFSITKSNSPTIIKKRYIDIEKNSKIIGVYDLNDEDISLSEENKFLNKLGIFINKFDVVIIADYGHGLLTKRIINFITQKSKFLCVNTQLNSANRGYHTISKYKKANLVCMNEGELRHDFRSKKDNIEKLIKSLQKRLNANYVIITRGEKGALFYNKALGLKFCPAFAEKVVDKIGAGDALYSIMSIFTSIKANPDLSLLIGNLSAGDAVGNIGKVE